VRPGWRPGKRPKQPATYGGRSRFGLASNDGFTRFEIAKALALLAGLGENAKSGVTAAEAKAFASRAVPALAGAIKAGWRPLGMDDPKGPDFDALRHREDFQKLLAELDKKVAEAPGRK
jgi:hypothetical protein